MATVCRCRAHGRKILGTSETLLARAEVSDSAWRVVDPSSQEAQDWNGARELLRDGSWLLWDHAGETEVFWDTEETKTVAGATVFLCADGEEHTADELELHEEDDDED